MIWIGILIGLFMGAPFGVLLGAILAAASESYTGPMAPHDDREQGVLP